jgi:hypothetical protein
MTRYLTLALSIALLSAGTASAAPAEKKPAPASPSPAPAAADTLPIFDPEADGSLTIAYYKSVCDQSNRRLLLVFGTNDCKPCRNVNKAIYEPKFLTQFLRQFVPAFVDVTAGNANAAIPAQFGVDPKAPLPAIVIIGPRGGVNEVLREGEMAEIAAKGPEAVELWIIQRFERSKPE